MRRGLCDGHRDLIDNHREHAALRHRMHGVNPQAQQAAVGVNGSQQE